MGRDTIHHELRLLKTDKHLELTLSFSSLSSTLRTALTALGTGLFVVIGEGVSASMASGLRESVESVVWNAKRVAEIKIVIDVTRQRRRHSHLPLIMDPSTSAAPTYQPNPSQTQKALWEAYVFSRMYLIDFSVPFVPDLKLGILLFISEQLQLKQHLVLADDLDFSCDANGRPDGLRFVAGVDLSFPLDNQEDAVACLVVLEYPILQVRQMIIDIICVKLHD